MCTFCDSKRFVPFFEMENEGRVKLSRLNLEIAWLQWNAAVMIVFFKRKTQTRCKLVSLIFTVPLLPLAWVIITLDGVIITFDGWANNEGVVSWNPSNRSSNSRRSFSQDTTTTYHSSGQSSLIFLIPSHYPPSWIDYDSFQRKLMQITPPPFWAHISPAN